MPVLNIVLDGDGCWPDLVDKELIHLGNDAKPIGVALLVGGMLSGAPSVMMRLELPDGRVVMAETSFRLFRAAARAFDARLEFLGIRVD